MFVLPLFNEFPKVEGEFNDEIGAGLEYQLQVDCLGKD
jgi:hypothetical protein